jgi:hypothetical protein
LNRRCAVCGRSIEHLRPGAKYCSTAHRMVAYRALNRPRAATDVVVRHDAAMEIVPSLRAREQRRDLLLAVVWPEDERLWRAA